MAIKEIYKSGFRYSQTDDSNPVIPAIEDVLQSASQMPSGYPSTDFVVWDEVMGAAKFMLDINRPTSTSSTHTGRVEHDTRYPNIRLTEEVWWSGSYYFDEESINDPLHEVLYQWHGYGGSPPISLRRGSSRLYLQIWLSSGTENQMWFDLGPDTPGVWHNFVSRIVFSDSINNGRVTMWKDGELAKCHSNITGEPWIIPTSGSGYYAEKASIGSNQSIIGGVSRLDFMGRNVYNYPNTNKYPKWGIYKPSWTSKYDSETGEILPGVFIEGDPLYVEPGNRLKVFWVKNINFETRVEQFSHDNIFKSISVDGETPINTPDWWVGSDPISITAPSHGQNFIVGSSVEVVTDATSGEVDLVVEGNVIDSKDIEPYSFAFENIPRNGSVVHLPFNGNLFDWGSSVDKPVLINPSDSFFITDGGIEAISLGNNPSNELRSYVSVPPLNISNQFTVGFNFRGALASNVLLTSYVLGGNGIRISTISGGRIEAYLNYETEGSTYRLRSNAAHVIDPINFNRLDITYDSEVFSLYFNGQLSDQIPALDVDVSSAANWLISASPQAVSNLDFYNFRIYDYSIAEEEINKTVEDNFLGQLELKVSRFGIESDPVIINIVESIEDYEGPYHISNSGSDVNNGSEAFPFATFEKALSVVQQGDTIKFECGGSYPPISISGLNGIASGRYYVTNYGTGPNPVISGFVTPTWVSQGNNIWTFQDSEFTTVNLLKLGNGLRHKGRLPKTGYNTITNRTSNTQITDTVNLPTMPNVVGGELVAKKNKWVMDTQTITEQTSTTLTTNVASGYQYTIGYGYFVQNHINCLTENGDWYYNSSTKTVHLYHTTDPNLLDIQIGKSENCLYQQSSSYWEFFGIDFEGSVKEAAILRSSHNIKFTRCSFNYHGFNGVQTWLSRYAKLEYCHLNDIQNIAVNNRDTGAENPSSDMTIKNCYINGIAMIPGASGNGDGQACGIKIGSTEHNVTIRNNRFHNLGYIGVYAAGNNCLVESNYAENGCLVKSDGALFYTFGSFTGIVFRKNIGINCYGNVEGTNHSGVFGAGDSAIYYADDNSDGVLFEYNYGSGAQMGWYGHNCQNVSVINNIFINNHIQCRIADDGYDNPNLGDPVANLNVQNNKLIAGSGQFVHEIRGTGGNFAFGTINNNQIKSADLNNYRVRREGSMSNPGTYLKTLSQWRTDQGFDVDSTLSDYDQEKELILVNETGDSELFELDEIYEDIEGEEISGSLQLDENESIYLYKTSDIPPVEEHTVILIAGTGGTVSGGGVYEDGEQATAEATPDTGWHFVRWSNDVTDNPYTFTVTGDITLQAIFAQDEPVPGVIIVKGKFRIV